MAYRGRLLVELETKLGEEIDKELEVMKGPELIRVQVVLNGKDSTENKTKQKSHLNRLFSRKIPILTVLKQIITISTPIIVVNAKRVARNCSDGLLRWGLVLHCSVIHATHVTHVTHKIPCGQENFFEGITVSQWFEPRGNI